MRQALRTATRQQHDALDDAMGPLGFNQGSPYAHFLQIQLAARQPIETWLARECDADILPPAQSLLLEADLADVRQEPWPAARFAPPPGANPIGAIWVLAGSSLGNRMILKRRREAGIDAPERFLADPAMPQFFARFRPLVERQAGKAETEAAVLAAKSVFATFLDLAGREHSRAAA